MTEDDSFKIEAALEFDFEQTDDGDGTDGSELYSVKGLDIVRFVDHLVEVGRRRGIAQALKGMPELDPAAAEAKRNSLVLALVWSFSYGRKIAPGEGCTAGLLGVANATATLSVANLLGIDIDDVRRMTQRAVGRLS